MSNKEPTKVECEHLADKLKPSAPKWERERERELSDMIPHSMARMSNRNTSDNAKETKLFYRTYLQRMAKIKPILHSVLNF